MTKEEFKIKWESSEDGGGITMEDIACCAKTWGISSSPKTRPMDLILYQVLLSANVTEAEEYNPNNFNE